MGDEQFLQNFLFEYLLKDQRKKLVCLYWLHGVGSMGDAEMVLFSCLFGVNLLIVKNTVDGPEIQSGKFIIPIVDNHL
jgi:hypothetical protein